MSEDFIVVMDSGGDPVRPEHEKHMIVPMNILFDGGTYTYPGDLLREDVVHAILQHKPGEVRTSQPSPKQIMSAVEATGFKQVLYITLSSGLSGTFNAAVVASRLLEKKGIKMVPFDSKSASLGMGVLLDRALQLRDDGKTMEEVVEELKQLRGRIVARFAIPTLDYLVAGGRLDPFKAAIAKLVGIRPILWINKDGAIDLEETVRSKDLWRHFVAGVCKEAYIAKGPLADKSFELARAEFERSGKKIVKVVDISPILLVHTGLEIVGELHHDEC